MAASAALLVAAIGGLSLMGRAFLPEFHEGSLTIWAKRTARAAAKGRRAHHR